MAGRPRYGKDLTTKSPEYLSARQRFDEGYPIDLNLCAALLGIVERTARLYAHQGKFGAVKQPDGGWLFDRELIKEQMGVE